MQSWIDNLTDRINAGPCPPRGTAAKFAADHIGQRVGWLTDTDFAAMLCKHFAFPDITPDDFLHKQLTIGAATALTGIRFNNRNPDKPFVDLEAVTGNVPLSQWCAAAFAAWEKFNPHFVRWYTPGAEPPADNAIVDQHLLVGRLGEIEPCRTRIEITDADPGEALPWLELTYAAFKRRSPDLAERVNMADADDLQRCVDDGRLIWWHRDRTRAGLLGVAREIDHGFDGFQVIEEAVGPDHIGHRTAPPPRPRANSSGPWPRRTLASRSSARSTASMPRASRPPGATVASSTARGGSLAQPRLFDAPTLAPTIGNP